MLTVSATALGRKKTLLADWSVPFPPDLRPDGDRLTLRDLISRIVRAEVEAFRHRQDERRLTRALTADDVAAGALRGKITAGGQDLKQDVDPEQAVGTALQAFADGLYLVVLDGEEQRELDRELFLRPDSRVTFVRLAMLAGG
jgi:hypothetical protein